MSSAPIELHCLVATSKFGLKGAGAAAWLCEQGITAPSEIYQVQVLDGGGRIVLVGTSEYLIEVVGENGLAQQWEAALSTLPHGVYRVPRAEATFVLSGPASGALLAQTCGIDFQEASVNRVVFTRVAGVSCGIVPTGRDRQEYWIWVDCSYSPYLWSTLAEIAVEMGGDISQSRLLSAFIAASS